MHCDNIQTLMDWALIESACFLLASVSPLLSTSKYHIHHQQHAPPHSPLSKEKEVSNFETSQIHTKQINARSLARSIGNQNDSEIGKATRNDKWKTKNHPFGCVSNMSEVRESDIEYMAAHPRKEEGK
jgi:hypothetical protein